MNFKKSIGSLLLMLTALVINSGTASAFSIGTEEMPDSIKNLR